MCQMCMLYVIVYIILFGLAQLVYVTASDVMVGRELRKPSPHTPTPTQRRACYML